MIEESMKGIEDSVVETTRFVESDANSLETAIGISFQTEKLDIVPNMDSGVKMDRQHVIFDTYSRSRS